MTFRHIFTIALLSLCALVVYLEQINPRACVDERRVAAIIEMKGRSTIWIDAGGNRFEENQAHYNVGDVRCVMWERK